MELKINLSGTAENLQEMKASLSAILQKLSLMSDSDFDDTTQRIDAGDLDAEIFPYTDPEEQTP